MEAILNKVAKIGVAVAAGSAVLQSSLYNGQNELKNTNCIQTKYGWSKINLFKHFEFKRKTDFLEKLKHLIFSPYIF